ncbi:hypothetical protein [Steroidobacter agaridevorans]|uniref:hypothetical protein n=1 Tax=Steroidobacter agaridevorans TaxID=2695856 RepID=UPI0013229E78|nr:hypothetical protein [Steroidobacter agaridevorans]GFE87567.1 hypothetical protein GCM10011488_25210 [Steroidobacter agaridevorans]
MTSRPPPRIATWLLQRCLRGRHAESLVGDLLELHEQGKSRGWYWRQVLAAVGTDVADAARASGRSLIVAVVVGWCAILLWRELNAVFIAYSGDIFWSLRRAGMDRSDGLLIAWGLGALMRFVCFIASGWLVARLNVRHPALAVAVFAASVLLIPVPWQQIRLPYAMWPVHYGMALAGIVAGAWLAGRRRRRYSITTGS